MKIKKLIKRFVFGYRAYSDIFVKHLRKKGMRIGNGTEFIDPRTTILDETRPWMICIGKGCCITGGVTVLTHDYGWSVCKAVYGDVIGSAAPVKIGDYVYIGMHTTILGGVAIGNNVIIGANSLVTEDVPDNVVVAGNPARVIRSLDEYHKKRKAAELREAVNMVAAYKSVHGVYPAIEVMREHFWLFEDSYDDLITEFKSVMNLVYGTEEKTREKFSENKKKFKNYEEFLEYCDKQEGMDI